MKDVRTLLGLPPTAIEADVSAAVSVLLDENAAALEHFRWIRRLVQSCAADFREDATRQPRSWRDLLTAATERPLAPSPMGALLDKAVALSRHLGHGPDPVLAVVLYRDEGDDAFRVSIGNVSPSPLDAIESFVRAAEERVASELTKADEKSAALRALLGKP